ncbi:MAG: hypothetical protein M5U28_11490 [Sandaracinaceae bacterium]|nr:hypothetical protein [Sandaracinaceae bacterium]
MRTLAYAAALLSLSAALPAAGQDALFEQVAELRARGLDLAAARLLDAERRRSPSPRITAELGLAYLGAGRAVDAETHLASATGAEGDAWIDEHQGGLELALRYARARSRGSSSPATRRAPRSSSPTPSSRPRRAASACASGSASGPSRSARSATAALARS